MAVIVRSGDGSTLLTIPSGSAVGAPKEKIRIEPVEVPVPDKTPAPVEKPVEEPVEVPA